MPTWHDLYHIEGWGPPLRSAAALSGHVRLAYHRHNAMVVATIVVLVAAVIATWLGVDRGSTAAVCSCGGCVLYLRLGGRGGQRR